MSVDPLRALGDKAIPASCMGSYRFTLLVLAERGYMVEVTFNHFTGAIDA
jgi:hypothetical protein